MYAWVRAKFNQMIREEIDAGRRIAVCPYGEAGMILADLLEKAYGIKDVIILDNGLAGYNPAIYPLSELQSMDTKEMTLILTSVSGRNNEELVREINGLGTDIRIRNILKPEIRQSPHKESYFLEIKGGLCCRKVVGKNYVRIGGNTGDGGYIMVDDFDTHAHAYSFGIGSDVSWDLDIADRGLEVFLYDHTIRHLPQAHRLFCFNRVGVGAGVNCSSLEKILEKNHDLESGNLIMKMDIEGAEWEELRNTPSALLSRFSQITLELHDVCKLENRDKILDALQKLNMTHQAVWVHGNNSNWAEEANGIIMPNLLEATFISRKNYLFESGKCIFPMPLDLPNLNGRWDFDLGNWGSIG